MALSPELKKSVLLGVFNRRGGHTLAFDDWDKAVRERVCADLEFGANEKPVILSAPDENAWLLVTTDRVIICVPGFHRSLTWAEIADVDPDISGKMRAGSRSHDKPPYLDIIDRSGAKLRTYVESGPAYVAVWNVLLRIIRMSRSADATGTGE